MPVLMAGDVLLTRTAHSLPGEAIRLGAALEDDPNTINHVIGVTHRRGRHLWGIEGRPGGVGWVDVTHHLRSPWTLDNRLQPKTIQQRQLVVAALKAAVGTPYDWTGIALDAADALDLPHLFDSTEWGPAVPGHAVCSSLLGWAYRVRAALAAPGKDHPRTVTPGDWARYWLEHLWSSTTLQTHTTPTL